MPKVALYRSERWALAPPDRAARQLLILRTCRPDVFAAAVLSARERYPNAAISALTHRGHRESVRAAGVDRSIEIPGRQFGLLRMRPWTLARLRARRFDVVVIPQMTADLEDHANLYRLVAALDAARVVVLPGPDAPLVFERRDFRHFAFWSSCRESRDVVLLLGMLAAACLSSRAAIRPANGRRRRVLHIISHLGVGGAQRQLLELVNRMPAEQYDVTVLALGGSEHGFSRSVLRRDDVEVISLAEWPRLPHSVREIMIRCQAGDFDVVHTWLFLANVIGAAAARLAGVPLVIASVRNLSVWKRECWYRKWWHRLADVLASHVADVVTVNASALVADHARWAWMHGDRIEVVHNGLDPAQLTANRFEARQRLLAELEAPGDALIVGTVGRLAFEKDQETFIRILALVRQDHRHVHGVVVGSGDRRAALERLVGDLGLTGAVTFFGERPDARQLVAGFDLFVLTSRSEGFPNVLLEATFLGVPCVATNIAGNPDVLGLDDSLFPAGDVMRGTQRVLAALADMPLTRQRTAVVRRRALDLFTAKRSVRAWLDLYRRHIDTRVATAVATVPAARVDVPGTR